MTMLLTELEVEQFRRFSGVWRLEGLGAGLNLLAAPNEAGKSTMFAALRAVFMLKFNSKAQTMRLLAPYEGGAPRVAARFTLNGRDLRLEKRFLSRPFARLSENGRLLEGDDAEDQLQQLLGLSAAKSGEAAGMLGALWVAQGESFTPPKLGDPAQATIRDCLEADLGEVTGGAAAGRIIQRVRADLGELLNGHGKPRGRYLAAIDGAAAAEAEIVTLERRQAGLEEDVAALAQCRRLLAVADDARQREADLGELHSAKAHKDNLLRFSAREAEARANAREAARVVQGIRDEQQRRVSRRAALKQAARTLAEADQDVAVRNARLAEADTALAASRMAMEAAETRLEAANRGFRMAEQRVERLRLGAAHHAATRVFDRLTAAQSGFERARAALEAIRMDEAGLRTIRTAERAHDAAQAMLSAQATVLAAALLPGGAARILLNGAPLPDRPIALVEAAELTIEGVGTFRITPGIRDRDQAQAAIVTARRALDAALARVHCADVAAAELAMDARRLAEAGLAAARAQRDAALPDGVREPEKAHAGLRREIAALAARLAEGAISGDGEQTPEAAGQALEAARVEQQAAERAVAAARAAVLDPDAEQRLATSMLDQSRAALFHARDQNDRLLGEENAAQAQEEDAALVGRADAARLKLEEMERAVARLDADRPEGTEALADAAIRRLEERIGGAAQRLAQLREENARMESRVQHAEGEGLDEAIASARREAARLSEARAACEREISVLSLMRDTLESAEREATERYLAPLTRAVQPALAMMFPGAQVQMGGDFALSGLTRRMVDEPLAALSDGTREQIAVLVRLGLADLLRAQGLPAMLVLDDALCFSDAGRLETMFDILTEAATRLQIVVMTCRAEAFTRLQARPLVLRAV